MRLIIFFLLVKFMWIALSYANQDSAKVSNDDYSNSSSDFDSNTQEVVHYRSKRSLKNFNQLIVCYQPWAHVKYTLEKYSNYGCYCGVGGKGIPLDETDYCCYVHDKCYAEAEEGHWPYAAYFTNYEYKCKNNTGFCDADYNSDFQQKLCECDKVAAECFFKNRPTYSEALKNVDTGSCCSIPPKKCHIQNAPHVLGRLYKCDLKFQQDKCCVDKGYNSYFQKCCDGNIQPYIYSGLFTLPCCGKYNFNYNYDVCCHGVIHKKIGELIKCCGDTGGKVDLRTHRCVDGKAVSINETLN